MEDIGSIIEGVRSLPMEEVIGNILPLSRKGSYNYGLCPFHNDSKSGSFVVTANKNVWKCFACPDSPGGDAIDFVAKYHNLEPLAAILKIALDFKIITPEEYESFSSGKHEKLEYKPVEKIKKKIHQPASPHILDTIYKIFMDICELSEGDQLYLLYERNNDIAQLGEYITLPNRNQKPRIIKELIERLGKVGISSDILGFVPGFFWNSHKKRWDCADIDGIAFAIRNIDQQIIRLQIRKRTAEKDQRYIWFSSSFAEGHSGKLRKGTSSGSPIDVVHPQKYKFPIITVTEGKFKALALSKLNLMSLSMQGISSWKRVPVEIERVLKKHPDQYPPNEVEVWLCYDQDIVNNPHVRDSANNLKDELVKMGLNVLFAVWGEQYGKGIDDVISNGHQRKIVKVNTLPTHQ